MAASNPSTKRDTDGRRGAKHPAKVDPIVALVATADRALEDHVKAHNRLEAARAKLSARDQFFTPWVGPPEGMNFTHNPWQSDYRFTSEADIDNQFRLVAKRLNGEIKDARGKKPSQLTRERQQLIFRNKMVLALLPKFKGPLKKAWRAERRRLLRVQKRVGLHALVVKSTMAFDNLYDLTRQIAKAKPATAAGALALVGYVGWRSWSEYQDFFSENGDIPGHFAEVLRAAGQRLQRSIAA
jgi:hypothetical protein